MSYPRSFELVKLIAFALMLLDHVNMLLLDQAHPWMHWVSRIAFPAFVFLFAFGCAFTRRIEAVMVRLVVAGSIAQALWWYLVPGYGLNVLFVMLLAAVASCGEEGGWWPSIAVFALYLVAVPFIEGGALGFWCIVAGLVAGRWWRGPHASRIFAGLVDRGPRLPRLGPWLLAGYPLHLAVIGLVHAAGR